MIAAIVITVVVVSVVCFYIYRKHYALQLFAKEGIPGPEPNWLLGNFADFTEERTRHLVLPKWTKQYGRVYGYYEGSRPVLVTSDTDIVNQVFVKQFQTFHAKKEIPMIPTSMADAVINKSMLIAYGDKWKRLRTIASPTFTTGKLRALMPLMTKCQSNFMQLMDKKAAAGKSFDIFKCIKLLTVDTIAETAFGIELNATASTGINPVVKAIDDCFRVLFVTPFTVQLAMIIPEISKPLRYVEFFKIFFMMKFLPDEEDVLKMVSNEIEARKRNPHVKGNRQDLLQMMLELENSEDLSGLKRLTTEELSGQSALFMTAGYDTTSNTLAIACFLLANDSKVQNKLIAEIDSNNSKVGFPPDYEQVLALPYLDAVINETLRLYPVVPLFVNRMAMDDTVVSGIHIPKGLTVMADIWTIHRDEELWGPVDPENFYPERFSDDYPTKATRPEAAFLPFGFGPRICLGMRFALLEIKLALVNILRKYRIEKTERTGDSLTLTAGITITPVDGIHVKLVKRESVVAH